MNVSGDFSSNAGRGVVTTGTSAANVFHGCLTASNVTGNYSLATTAGLFRLAHVDARQIGKGLGVRYIVEGSVRKSGDTVRIVAQLIDATTGEHVWAERYDREGSDPLSLQDDVTTKIVNTVSGEQGLIRKKEYEDIWGKDSSSLAEYDYYLRGHYF
jgi:hypothetical protein